MTTGPLTNLVLSGVPGDSAAAASGVANTAQEGGAAIGVAVGGVVFFGLLGPGSVAYPDAFVGTLLGQIACCLVAAVLIALLPRATAPA